jgi:nitrite reductase (NADH) small subunit
VTWHRALPAIELVDGAATRVVLDERAVMIVSWEGALLAVTDVCPHNGASLSEGVLRDGCVTCPSHFWRFSIVDGAKQGDPRTHLAVYPVRVTGGWIEVDLPALPPWRSLRETLLAHARGEVIPPDPDRRTS